MRHPTQRGLALVCFAGLLGTCALLAGEPEAASRGPVIERFGPTYAVPDPDFATPADRDYRLVFDVAASDDRGPNPRIETLARFLNMHARAGVPRERMKLALVIHGAAARDVLNREAYRRRFDRDNPNLPLLRALRKAGVEVILCGQTAAYRGYAREELAGGVRVALSAMTALAVLQDRGYGLIAF